MISKILQLFSKKFYSFLNMEISSRFERNPIIYNILYYKFSKGTQQYINKKILYYGNKRYCPCCENYYNSFLPWGKGPGFNHRKDAVCPGCGSFERQRLIWLFFKNKTNIFKENLRILHFGPHYYIFKKLKKLSNLNYTSADLYSPFVDYKMDIRKIRFKENYFDVIICIHVFQFIQEDVKAMNELFRVLKPGGWAIIQTELDSKREKTFENPLITSPEQRKKFFGLESHIRIYGRDYKERLEKGGFKVEPNDYLKNFNESQKKIMGINLFYNPLNDEQIYYCEKSK